jgi:hypothetical protein
MRQPSLSLRVTLVACALGAIAVPALAQTAHDDSAVPRAVASKQKSEVAKGDPQRWYRGDNTTQGRLAIQKKEIAAAYSEAKIACRKGQSGERKQCLADAGKTYRSDLSNASRLVARGPSPEILEEVTPVFGDEGGGATAVGSSGAAGTSGSSGPQVRDWRQRNDYRAAGSETTAQANNQAGPTGAQSNTYQSGPTGNQPGMRQPGPTGSGQAGMGQSGAMGASQSGATSTGTSQYGVGGTGAGQSGTSQSGMTGTSAGQSGMGQSGAAGVPAGQPSGRGSGTSQTGAAGSSQSGATGSAPTEMNGSDATRPGAPPPELPRSDKPQDQRY